MPGYQELYNEFRGRLFEVLKRNNIKTPVQLTDDILRTWLIIHVRDHIGKPGVLEEKASVLFPNEYSKLSSSDKEIIRLCLSAMCDCIV